MTVSLRALARNSHAAERLIVSASTAAARPTLISRVCWSYCTSSDKRSIYTEKAPGSTSVERQPAQANPEAGAPISGKEDLLNLNWRHPRYGFAAADLPHILYIKLPRGVTEHDVNFLAARAGLQSAQIFMYYHFETGRPGDFCFLRVADRSKMDAAVANLSRFTLLGSEIKPDKLSLWKSPPYDPLLLAGWLPSPSSDLSARVIRPPITEPPKLLAPLMREQWVAFSALAIDLKDKASANKVAEAFYKRFHQFDVVGITVPRLHRSRGKSCKILFGNPLHAKAARKLHVNGKFLGKPGKAKIYRGGPQISQALLDYRQSLPEDMPADEISDLVEDKFKNMYPSPAEIRRWEEYPTPASAVVAKDD